MSMLEWPYKDPDDALDYGIDWSARLGEDTIAESTWIIPDGLTGRDDTHTDTTSAIWLEGGEDRRPYKVVNRIVTTAGRTWDQGVILRVFSS